MFEYELNENRFSLDINSIKKATEDNRSPFNKFMT